MISTVSLTRACPNLLTDMLTSLSVFASNLHHLVTILLDTQPSPLQNWVFKCNLSFKTSPQITNFPTILHSDKLHWLGHFFLYIITHLHVSKVVCNPGLLCSNHFCVYGSIGCSLVLLVTQYALNRQVSKLSLLFMCYWIICRCGHILM